MALACPEVSVSGHSPLVSFSYTISALLFGDVFWTLWGLMETFHLGLKTQHSHHVDHWCCSLQKEASLTKVESGSEGININIWKAIWQHWLHSKAAAGGSPHGLWLPFDQVFSITHEILPVAQASDLFRRKLVTHNSYATIGPVGTYCWAGCCWVMHCPMLMGPSRTVFS